MCQTHKNEGERDEKMLKERVYVSAVTHEDKANEYAIKYIFNMV